MAARYPQVIKLLKRVLQADTIVGGGGSAKLLRKLPASVRLRTNRNAFVGGYRSWTRTT